MPVGPGKYDDLCTYVREQAKAAGAIVIVIGGAKGAGFSVQAPPIVTLKLPALLRELAKQIEESIAAGPTPDGRA